MITHLYHGNLGQVIDENGKVLPIVREAERRGVIFDLGFGGYNFSWKVAEKSIAQDLIPHTISSDLQQFNVVRPVKSLANVMSAMLRLGIDVAAGHRAGDAQSREGDFPRRSGRQPEALVCRRTSQCYPATWPSSRRSMRRNAPGYLFAL